MKLETIFIISIIFVLFPSFWEGVEGRIVWYDKSSATTLIDRGWRKSKGLMTVPKFWSLPRGQSKNINKSDDTPTTATNPFSSSSINASTSIDRDEIEVYLERYRRNRRTKNHLILLAGGPGQRSSVWHQDLSRFSKLVGPDTTIYLIDHRGLGRSSPEKAAKGTGWRLLSTLTFNPTWINPTDAAHDVAHLAQLLRRRNARSANIILLGVSYGGWWASRTATLHPNLFDWLILDSPSMNEHRFDRNNDEDFWRHCQENRPCRKALGGGIKTARKIYNQVLQEKVSNSCMIALKEKTSLSMVEILRPYLRGMVDMGANDGNLHSAMLVIPFILSLYHCQDPNRFKNHILPGFLRHGHNHIKEGHSRAKESYSDTSRTGIYTEFSQIAKDSHVNLHLASHPASYAAEKSHSSNPCFNLHDFVNAYLCVGELYNYDQPIPKICRAKSSLITVTDQCANYGHYRSDHAMLKNHLYAREEDPHLLYNSIRSNSTRMIVLMGGMDVITPGRPVRKWIKKWVEVPEIHIVNYRKGGHGAAPDAPCLPLLFDGIINGREAALVEFHQCVRTENKKPLDWALKNCKLDFARRWMAFTSF